jgi:hypothetical protein
MPRSWPGRASQIEPLWPRLVTPRVEHALGRQRLGCLSARRSELRFRALPDADPEGASTAHRPDRSRPARDRQPTRGDAPATLSLAGHSSDRATGGPTRALPSSRGLFDRPRHLGRDGRGGRPAERACAGATDAMARHWARRSAEPPRALRTGARRARSEREPHPQASRAGARAQRQGLIVCGG